MKKLGIIVASAMLSTAANAQVDVTKNIDVDFYGVDFSLVKVMGAAERTAQFIAAFDGINMLFLNESSKYDIAKFLNKKDVSLRLAPVMAMNNVIDQSGLMAVASGSIPGFSAEQIAAQVKRYDLDPKYDTGMVIIAQVLDKSANYGYFHIVFFDTKTREVIYSKLVSGKAGGFGLRNFWAGSLYDVLRSWRW